MSESSDASDGRDRAASAGAAPASEISYGAFSTQAVDPSAPPYTPFWFSQKGEFPITFYRFDGGTGPWLPLGDVADGSGFPLDQLLFSPTGDPAAFTNPEGFTWLLDDAGSGNPNNVSYWAPVPLPGYTAVGICFTSGDPPDTANYWCVKNAYVQQATTVEYWSDAGAGWKHHNGDLLSPSLEDLPGPLPAGSVFVLPPTLLSAEAGSPSFTLVGTAPNGATVQAPGAATVQLGEAPRDPAGPPGAGPRGSGGVLHFLLSLLRAIFGRGR